MLGGESRWRKTESQHHCAKNDHGQARAGRRRAHHQGLTFCVGFAPGGVDDAFCKHTFFSYVETCPLKNPFLLLVNWKRRPDRIVCCLNGGSEVDSISEQIITLASNTGLWFNLMLFILIITVYLN